MSTRKKVRRIGLAKRVFEVDTEIMEADVDAGIMKDDRRNSVINIHTKAFVAFLAFISILLIFF